MSSKPTQSDEVARDLHDILARHLAPAAVDGRVLYDVGPWESLPTAQRVRLRAAGLELVDLVERLAEAAAARALDQVDDGQTMMVDCECGWEVQARNLMHAKELARDHEKGHGGKPIDWRGKPRQN